MPFGISAGTAALIGGGISAAGGVASGLIQSGATKNALSQQQHNLELVLPQMQTGYNQTVGAYQPYATAGTGALTTEQDLLGLNGQPAANAAMANFQQSPGYQYQLQQGLRGVDAGAASAGMLRSGATLKAEQTLGSNLANQDFGNYYSRIAALGTGGETAAGGLATANQNLIANETGNATAQNTALVGATNAQNSILGNTAQGLGNTANSLLNNQQFLSLINPGGGYGSAAPGTPGISASGNPVMTGFAAPMNIGSPGAYIPPTLPSY